MTEEMKETLRVETALMQETRLVDAIRTVRPYMDDTRDSFSRGGETLAKWMSWRSAENVWSQLLELPDTKRVEILKDSDLNRGRRVCIQGTVIQIFARQIGKRRGHSGVLETPSGDAVRFLAVHDTGRIVDKTPARFCGITTGFQTFQNLAGGTTIAVVLIGNFDLNYSPM